MSSPAASPHPSEVPDHRPVALVTGSSSGIGLAIARALSERGAHLVLTARSGDRLQAAARGLPGPSTVLPADVTDPSAPKRVVDATVESQGRLDVLVANAGIYIRGKVWENDASQIAQLITTNVTGTIGFVHAALPEMIARGHGDVVVTSSVSGHQAIPWEPVYSASKHALQSFVHGVRQQLIGTGVRMMSIAPGVVLNDLWSVTDQDQVAEGIAKGTGMRSEDVADAVSFMLTRPQHVTIRDLVLLPTNQQI